MTQYITFAMPNGTEWDERGAILATRVDGMALRVPADASIADDETDITTLKTELDVANAKLLEIGAELARVKDAAAATDEAAEKAERAYWIARAEADREKDRADANGKSFDRMSDAYAAQVGTTSGLQRRVKELEETLAGVGRNLDEERRQLKIARQTAARYADSMSEAIGIIGTLGPPVVNP